MVRSIGHVFFHVAERQPERPAFKEFAGAGRTWTYRELAEAVRETAIGLSSLGIQPGDRVGLFADSSIRWIQSDLAVLALGAADVPRGTDSTPGEIDYLMRHSGARVAILENRKSLDELKPALGDIADLRCIVLLEGSYAAGDPRPVLSLDEVRDRGRRLIAEGARLEPHLDRVRGDAIASIVYTSGTTGRPKGVMLTHDNVLHNIRAIPAIVEFQPDDVFLSILPAWHMFERLIEYAAISKGCLTVYTNKRTFKQDLLRERPTVLAAVPRLYELLYEEARRRLTDGAPLRRGVVNTLIRAGQAWRSFARGDARVTGMRRALCAACRPFHLLADRLVGSRFRSALGGRLRFVVSGGGSLPAHIDEFFDFVGLTLLNGYGLTETAPLVAVRHPRKPVLGTVGAPIRDTQVEVRDKDGRALAAGQIGVIHVKGPQVMSGYYQDRDATRRVIGEDRFFDTGDLGRLRPTGELEITGRAKDTIVLSGGENVEPEPIENQLRLSPFVEQVVVVGQDKKHLGALVVPALEAIRQKLPILAGQNDDALAPDDPRVRDLLRREFDRLLTRAAGFKACERIPRFAVLAHPFSIESGTLTETLKLKRHVIAERHKETIGSLFRE